MRFKPLALSLASCLAMAAPAAFADSIDDKIADLQRQLDELKQERERQQQEIAQLRQALEAHGTTPATAAQQPLPSNDGGRLVSTGGQYRINFYSADNDLPGEGNNQTAARLRLRQNIDIAFDQQFKTHVQFELQHTSDNVTTTDQRRGGSQTNVSVRHAVLDYTFRSEDAFNGTQLQVGLVPLQDNFHQTQFSADWDYNPLAASLVFPVGAGSLRLFAANLQEGSESDVDDDFVHYQADLSVPLGGHSGITLTGTALQIADYTSNGSSWHYNYGIGGHTALGGMTLSGFVMGSSTDRGLLGSRDASGVAALVELTGAIGPGDFGLLLSHASGEGDGTGFLMPMAFAQTFGYWGYTGILTVQGPTDTGFDFDGVNLSNNGYGLTSVQAKYGFPITSALTGYLAAGWFGNTDAAGRDDDVGVDLLAMTTYRFNPLLALDLGLAYARLQDSVSGYFQGVQTGTGAVFNQAQGSERDKFSLFGRIQVEF